MYSSVVKNIRIKIDYLTLEVIKEHPIIGIGFGLQSYSKLDLEGYQKRIPKEYRQKKIITDPHNMVLDVAVRLGVIGLGFFFYIIFVFFKMCRSIIKYGKDNSLKNWGICLAACFIGVCTIGLFQPIFSHMPEVVFCIIFSITHVVWQLNNEMISSESKVPKSKHDLFKY
jgi:O-antigen ligase